MLFRGVEEFIAVLFTLSPVAGNIAQYFLSVIKSDFANSMIFKSTDKGVVLIYQQVM